MMKPTWKQTKLLLIFAVLTIGVITTLAEAILIPFTSYGLIQLPNKGLIIIMVAAISLLYIAFHD